ncbi:MAG: hypothetical protein H0T57_10700 [Rubrobacter sp.]|nr:hypothetical protein [Rubrobacter sp.]
MLRRIVEGLRRFVPTPPRPTGAIKKRLFGAVVVGRDETVPGVYVVRGDVSVDGRVTGDVGCVFGTVTVRGIVGGDVRVLFGGVRVEGGEVAGSVELGYGKVGLGGETRVGGDVTVGRGNIRRIGSAVSEGARLPRSPHVGGRTRTNAVIGSHALAEVAFLLGFVALLLVLSAAFGTVALFGGKSAVLAAAAVVVAALALVGAFLWGLALGAKAALGQVNNLRRHAECRGGGGCEWVVASGHPLAGEPLTSEHIFRYYRPFGRLPGLRRTALGRIEYDLAE